MLAFLIVVLSVVQPSAGLGDHIEIAENTPVSKILDDVNALVQQGPVFGSHDIKILSNDGNLDAYGPLSGVPSCFSQADKDALTQGNNDINLASGIGNIGHTVTKEDEENCVAIRDEFRRKMKQNEEQQKEQDEQGPKNKNGLLGAVAQKVDIGGLTESTS